MLPAANARGTATRGTCPPARQLRGARPARSGCIVVGKARWVRVELWVVAATLVQVSRRAAKRAPTAQESRAGQVALVGSSGPATKGPAVALSKRARESLWSRTEIRDGRRTHILAAENTFHRLRSGRGAHLVSVAGRDRLLHAARDGAVVRPRHLSSEAPRAARRAEFGRERRGK
jgi:hypothetical protein